MKNLKVYLVAAVIFMSVIPVSLKADTGDSPAKTVPKSIAEVRLQVLINRLEEIKAIDKSDLKRSEKKELKKEVKAISKELRSSNNGVYISVGGAIIIILLLILLL